MKSKSPLHRPASCVFCIGLANGLLVEVRLPAIPLHERGKTAYEWRSTGDKAYDSDAPDWMQVEKYEMEIGLPPFSAYK